MPGYRRGSPRRLFHAGDLSRKRLLAELVLGCQSSRHVRGRGQSRSGFRARAPCPCSAPSRRSGVRGSGTRSARAAPCVVCAPAASCCVRCTCTPGGAARSSARHGARPYRVCGQPCAARYVQCARVWPDPHGDDGAKLRSGGERTYHVTSTRSHATANSSPLIGRGADFRLPGCQRNPCGFRARWTVLQPPSVCALFEAPWTLPLR